VEEDRLKIAYIMSGFPKLSETYILCEMIALEKLGATVEVYPLFKPNRQAITHREAQAWIERAHYMPFVSFAILRANWHYFRSAPLHYLKLWFELLAGTLGSMNSLTGTIKIFPKVVRFAHEMERSGIDHVHAHFANHPAMAAYIIHRLTELPFSFTAHGPDLYAEGRMLAAKVKAAAVTVTVCNCNKQVIVAKCGESIRGKVHVVHCGVDPSLFSPAQRQPGTGRFQILCVGALELVKGHRYLIEACRLLKKRGVNFICHIVGEGRLRRQIQRRITSARLRGHVFLYGGASRSQVAEMFKHVDVAVLASAPTRKGEREGIPVVLMEAGASGLPVVATAGSGIAELVENGKTGLLVPRRDPTALANALETLNRDAPMRFQMGMAGREKVLDEFNLWTNAAHLLRLIEYVHGRNKVPA
jgi:glycosyltransferase involved in cell wall biosynthesis